MSSPPWHLWGGEQTVKAIANANATSTQLCRIAYKRPVMWRFLFSADILLPTNQANGTMFVSFDVQVGIGRAMTTLKSFELFTWTFPLAVGNTHLYSTNVVGPPRNFGGALPQAANVIDQVVAENIQVVANVGNLDLVTNAATNVVVSAFFSPQDHIRPDWYNHSYSGGETGGS